MSTLSTHIQQCTGYYGSVLVFKSCMTLVTPWTAAHRLPCPSPSPGAALAPAVCAVSLLNDFKGKKRAFNV